MIVFPGQPFDQGQNRKEDRKIAYPRRPEQFSAARYCLARRHRLGSARPRPGLADADALRRADSSAVWPAGRRCRTEKTALVADRVVRPARRRCRAFADCPRRVATAAVAERHWRARPARWRWFDLLLGLAALAGWLW